MHGRTAPNRTVYASPPVGGSVYKKTQSAYGLCAFFSGTFLQLLETYGFLYRNRKNVVQLSRYMQIVNYIVNSNVKDYNYFEKLFNNKIDIKHYLFNGSACVFPGVRRYISNHAHATRKYNESYKAIIDDNVFPRYIWCYLLSGKGYSGPNWKATKLNEFELAHIFVHKESEIINERNFFGEINKDLYPYAEFTSAANVILLPKGTERPTDNSTILKTIFYKRYIELYGENTLNGRKGFIENKVPSWYSDIKWNTPLLPSDWKKNTDTLLEYRKEKITSILKK